jgi:hypothetical protein
MFEALLFLAVAISAFGIICAYDGSRDVFHPLVFIGPMFIFLYGWMPWNLFSTGGLTQFFDDDQLLFVQRLNVLGIVAFVTACLGVGIRMNRPPPEGLHQLPPLACRRLLIGAGVFGAIGLMCWSITIINVGGFVNAFSASYSGGWDDSGYVRDGSLLLLVGVLLSVSSISAGGPSIPSLSLMMLYGLPWLVQAILMARRGPTFSIVIIVLMGWYINRKKRPPIFAVGALGICLGWLVLFLVTNRSNIYLGSNFDVSTDVSSIVDKPDPGNEYVYGAGTVLSSERRGRYFWMRRYLAQLLVRPVPSAIWPTKYEDFGVPELLRNAGTGEGFGDVLGWKGAVGSAPGIIADLWVELWWLSVPAMAVLGWCYGFVWQKAVTRGGPWSSQYVILSALSIYLVMQTMEAVIFRTILLSVPCWLTWKWALRARSAKRRLIRHHQLSLMQHRAVEHV